VGFTGSERPPGNLRDTGKVDNIIGGVGTGGTLTDAAAPNPLTL
jgi:hypothetical protein